jgi:hypothetical protein
VFPPPAYTWLITTVLLHAAASAVVVKPVLEV